jgi:hypothetical protein
MLLIHDIRYEKHMGILCEQLEIRTTRLSSSTEAVGKGSYNLTWDRTRVTTVGSGRLILPELLF